MADIPAADRIRRPEYTGDNRCLPCTAVNLGIASLISGVVALASIPVAVALFVASMLAIYLRGYLVPGTPALTKRYLPESVAASVGEHPVDDTPEFETLEKLDDHRENAVEPEQFLRDVGVFEDGDKGRLTETFTASRRAALERRDRSAASDPGVVAGLFDDPDDISFEDRAYPAVNVDRRIRSWPSEAALLGDVVTDEALSATTDRWASVPIEQRLDILELLRQEYDACPACGGPLERSPDTVESCCGVFEVIAVRCLDCGDRLQELHPSSRAATLDLG